jgi:hypothetical protein
MGIEEIFDLQIALWVFSGLTSDSDPSGLSRVLSCCFMAVVSLIAAAGFLVYGGRLFLMLRRSATHARSHLGVLHNSACVLTIASWRVDFSRYQAVISANLDQ